ncbi:MAG: hypothetical protein RLZ33_2635 [Bacteroidota bacterium]|jgi:hypothetical protein
MNEKIIEFNRHSSNLTKFNIAFVGEYIDFSKCSILTTVSDKNKKEIIQFFIEIYIQEKGQRQFSVMEYIIPRDVEYLQFKFKSEQTNLNNLEGELVG